MANITSNSLFFLSALLFVGGLLFLAYPYLTFTIIVLCGIGYASYTHKPALVRFYSYASSKLWPAVDDRPAPCISSLFSGVDLLSPIPHIPSGLETVKNRKSPVDEIISSTPRSTPTNHGVETSVPMPIRSSPQVASDSRQLNFGKITPKSSRTYFQDVQLSSVDGSTSHNLRQRSNSTRTVQTMAGPLLSSARYNPPFDAGIFVNVNSPGFTDRLMRCANDRTGIHWGPGNLATRQDKYGTVGLFPIVHLNAPSTPSLSVRNSQKAPNSSVRVRIAPPAYNEQRQHFSRENNINIRSSAPLRDSSRRNDVTKSVLESLQEASRKRIYSQCQEVLEEDPGKKRQKKGDSALPNPNCDMYQYRHIRAPAIPSNLGSNTQSETNLQIKRVHDDPSSRVNEPKRQRQHGKPQTANNEISSSLSSSKTLLQQLSGNKRKAEIECLEEYNGKHFKDSQSPSAISTTSRWLHSQSSDEEGSAARTQGVVRSQNQRKSSPDSSKTATQITVQKNPDVSEINNKDTVSKPTIISEKRTSDVISHQKVETDLTSKLFRKDTTSRLHQRTTQSEKKGSSWTQDPPDADERCLSEQGSSSELDRPERFQSLMSRMCGQDIHTATRTDALCSQVASESSNSIKVTTSIDNGKDVLNKTSSTSEPSDDVVSVSSSIPSVSLIVSSHELGNKLLSASTAVTSPSLPHTSLFTSSSLPPHTSSSVPFTPSCSVGSALQGMLNAPEKIDVADKPSLSIPPASSVIETSSSAAKPLFGVSVAQVSPSSVAPQTGSAPVSTVTPFPAPQSIFQSNLLSKETTAVVSVVEKSEGLGSVLPTILKPSETPSQSNHFPSFTAQPQTTVASFSGNFTNRSSLAENTLKFPMPGQKIQFSTSSCNFVPPQQHTTAAPHILAPPSSQSSFQAQSVPSTSSFSAASSSPAQAVASSSSGQQTSFGGFTFSGPSGTVFGGAPANSATSFSFTAAQTSVATSLPANSTPDKVLGVSTSLVTPDPKPTVGSGSITFGTVSAVAQPQPPNSMTFAFSSPVGGSLSSNEASKSPFSVGGGNANVNSTPGFSIPSSQGVFSGFRSIQNLTSSTSSSFGASQQQLSQPHNQPPGFSFGSQSGQPVTSIAFGSTSPSSAQIFGSGTTQQQPTFGATTTSGFSSQPAALTFSNPPFGTATSSGSLSFGSSQLSSASPFGGQVASNPTPFGLSSSSNPPTFGNTLAPSGAFGATSPPSFGLPTSPEPSFGSNPSSAPAPPLGSAFNFGTSAEKPTVPTFNFGGTSGPSAPTFSFGSNEQQSQSQTNTPLFQFGQAANPTSIPAFQFGSPSSQPGGSGAPSFNMGSGPSTPQRSRALQTRRRRL